MILDRPEWKSKTERKMREDWDNRARGDALHYIASSQRKCRLEEFFGSGEESVQDAILNDLKIVCQGQEPKKMRILEIGCGSGRMTQALAAVFGEVHGVDVSGEMIAQARQLLTRCENVHLHQNNGTDLSVLGNVQFDFAFSFGVFQHIPDRAIIESYVHEAYRLLRPGGLFKFQVQGSSTAAVEQPNTWFGVQITGYYAMAMANQSGFDLIQHKGIEEQHFWLWYRKPVKSGIELRAEAFTTRQATGSASKNKHLARYRFAEKFVAGGQVLDLDFSAQEYAVQLTHSTTQFVSVKSIRNRHKGGDKNRHTSNLHSTEADRSHLPFPDASFDSVLAFLDVESITEWHALMAEVRRVLRKGGRLLVSAPSRHRGPATETARTVHEFTYEEFRTETAKFFRYTTIFLEKESGAITFTAAETRGVKTMVENITVQPKQVRSFLAVCSTDPFHSSPAFVHLPWGGNALRERENQIERLQGAVKQTDLLLSATAGEIKTLQQEYRQEQKQMHKTIRRFESELTRAVKNAYELEAEKDDVLKNLQKSAEMLGKAENLVIERTDCWQKIKKDLTKARDQLNDVYESPAFRFGQQLKLVPRYSDSTASYLHMDSSDAESHLLGGFYDLEAANWRWTDKRASAILLVPQNSREFELAFHIPEITPARRVTVELDGKTLIEKMYSETGSHILAVPVDLPAQRSVRVTISVNKTFRPTNDDRNLGIVVTAFGFQ